MSSRGESTRRRSSLGQRQSSGRRPRPGRRSRNASSSHLVLPPLPDLPPPGADLATSPAHGPPSGALVAALHPHALHPARPHLCRRRLRTRSTPLPLAPHRPLHLQCRTVVAAAPAQGYHPHALQGSDVQCPRGSVDREGVPEGGAHGVRQSDKGDAREEDGRCRARREGGGTIPRRMGEEVGGKSVAQKAVGMDSIAHPVSPPVPSSSQSKNLLEVIRSCQDIFSKQPPVYARPASSQSPTPAAQSSLSQPQQQPIASSSSASSSNSRPPPPLPGQAPPQQAEPAGPPLRPPKPGQPDQHPSQNGYASPHQRSTSGQGPHPLAPYPGSSSRSSSGTFPGPNGGAFHATQPLSHPHQQFQSPPSRQGSLEPQPGLGDPRRASGGSWQQPQYQQQPYRQSPGPAQPVPLQQMQPGQRESWHGGLSGHPQHQQPSHQQAYYQHQPPQQGPPTSSPAHMQSFGAASPGTARPPQAFSSPAPPDGPPRLPKPPQQDFLDSLAHDSESQAASGSASPSATAGPAPPRPLNPELLHLHTALHAKIAARIQHLRGTLAASNAHLRTIAADLDNGPSAIQDESARLQAVKSVCQTRAEKLEATLRQAEARTLELHNRPQPASSEIIVTDSILSNQLLTVVAQDLACTDTLYHLGRALGNEEIGMERYLKWVRGVGREQFEKRAIGRKIEVGRQEP